MAFDDTVFTEDYSTATYTPIDFSSIVFDSTIFETTLVETAFQDDAFQTDAFQAEKKPEVEPPCGHGTGRGYSPTLFQEDRAVFIGETGRGIGRGYSPSAFNTESSILLEVTGRGIGDGLPFLVRANKLSGSGTSGNPYLITNLADLELVGVSPYTVDKYFKVNNDFDASETALYYYKDGKGFLPIPGTFTGGFDGDNKVISNLTINRPTTDNVGLFGVTNSDNIKKIILEDCNIVGKNSVGCIAGFISEKKLEYCQGTGEVTGVTDVGGIVGRGTDDTWLGLNRAINYCTFEGIITGANRVGGIGGYLSRNLTFIGLECNATINVSGSEVGGIVGVFSGISATDLEFNGEVNGSNVSDYVGGICGKLDAGTIEDARATGTVTGRVWVGGICGGEEDVSWRGNAKKVNLAVFNGEINGSQRVGGISGSCWKGDAVVENSIANATINANGIYVGGIVGLLGSTNPLSIDNCLFRGEVLGAVASSDSVGGICGYMDNGGINESRSYGKVIGRNKVGGICGEINDASWNGNDGKQILLSRFKGEIIGGSYVGGLCGYVLRGNSTISGCPTEAYITATGSYIGGSIGYTERSTISTISSIGRITAPNSTYVGGLIGYNTVPVTDSYSHTKVDGNNHVGGLIGYDNGDGADLLRCYSKGEVIGVSNKGGLCGTKNGSPSSDYSYWDTETSLQSTSALGTGKTTLEMVDVDTYETYDFATPVWNINDDCLTSGYPDLEELPLLPGDSVYICIGEVGEGSGGDEAPFVYVQYPIYPEGIVSGESFGTPQLNFRIYLEGISSGEGVGTPILIKEQFIYPHGVVSDESFGTPQLNFRIYLEGISSGESFGTPVMGISLLPVGIGTEEAVGNPTLNFIIHSNWGSGGEEFGNLKLLLYLLVNGIASEEAIGDVNVIRLLQPEGISTEELFGNPQLNMIIKSLWGSGEEEFGILKMIMYLQAEGFFDETAVPGIPKIKLYVKPLGILSEEYVSSGINIAFDQWIVTLGIPGAESFGIALMIIEQFLNPEGIVSEETIGMHWIYNFYELVYADFNILNPVTDFDIMNDKADLEMKVPSPSIIMHPPKATFKVLQPITSFKFIE